MLLINCRNNLINNEIILQQPANNFFIEPVKNDKKQLTELESFILDPVTFLNNQRGYFKEFVQYFSDCIYNKNKKDWDIIEQKNKTIAHALGVHVNTVTNVTKRLVSMGFLKKHQDRFEDGRLNRYSLNRYYVSSKIPNSVFFKIWLDSLDQDTQTKYIQMGKEGLRQPLMPLHVETCEQNKDYIKKSRYISTVSKDIIEDRLSTNKRDEKRAGGLMPFDFGGLDPRDYLLKQIPPALKSINRNGISLTLKQAVELSCYSNYGICQGIQQTGNAKLVNIFAFLAYKIYGWHKANKSTPDWAKRNELRKLLNHKAFDGVRDTNLKEFIKSRLDQRSTQAMSEIDSLQTNSNYLLEPSDDKIKIANKNQEKPNCPTVSLDQLAESLLNADQQATSSFLAYKETHEKDYIINRIEQIRKERAVPAQSVVDRTAFDYVAQNLGAQHQVNSIAEYMLRFEDDRINQLLGQYDAEFQKLLVDRMHEIVAERNDNSQPDYSDIVGQISSLQEKIDIAQSYIWRYSEQPAVVTSLEAEIMQYKNEIDKLYQ